MKSLNLTGMAALAALTVAACSEVPTETSPDRDEIVPVALGTLDNFLNNPDNGNSRILRVESEPIVALFDDRPGSTLLALHSSLPVCGGTLVPMSVQEIHRNPEDPFAGRIIALLQAKEVNIWIVDRAEAGSCFGFDLVAGGTGRLQATDNDVFPTFSRGTNANAYGFMAHATLMTPSGARARYSAMQRTSWKPNGSGGFIFDHVTEKFNLKIQAR